MPLEALSVFSLTLRVLSTARLGVTTTADGSAPLNLVPPVVSGLLNVGDTLTVTDGVWAGPLPLTFNYQWFRDNGVTITPVGTDMNTYVLVAGDAGNNIFVQVFNTNPYGTTGQVSNTVGPVTSATSPPVNTVVPVVSGVVRFGNVLSCSSGTWTGAPAPVITYQWRRGGVAIPGATLSTRVVDGDDVRTVLDCLVTGTNLDPGSPVSVSSANTLASPWQPIFAVKPNVIIFDGLDPACHGGVGIGAPVPSMFSVRGTLLGSQALSASRATRTATGLDFSVDDYYAFLPTVAAYYNADTSYALHVSGLSGSTVKYFYSVASTSSPTIVRNARVAASASTSRNDHRTNATLMVGPPTADQHLVLRWEPSNSAIYDLSTGVSIFATVGGTPSTASFDSMNMGSNTVLSGYWQGTIRAWCVDATAWDTATVTIWRACALAAGAI